MRVQEHCGDTAILAPLSYQRPGPTPKWIKIWLAKIGRGLLHLVKDAHMSILKGNHHVIAISSCEEV
jgi:hypothetical protein